MHNAKYCVTGVMTDILNFVTIFHDLLVKKKKGPDQMYTVGQIQIDPHLSVTY